MNLFIYLLCGCFYVGWNLGGKAIEVRNNHTGLLRAMFGVVFVLALLTWPLWALAKLWRHLRGTV